MLHGAGIFTYIWVILVVNVGKYSIHGAYMGMIILLHKLNYIYPNVYIPNDYA